MTHGRKACRGGSPCEPASLAESIYCCVFHSELEAEAIAARLGVRKGYLQDAANADRDDTHFQARWLLPLMAVTGNLAPLQFISRQLGGIYVQLPKVPSSSDELFRSFTRAASNFGAAGAALDQALADRHLTQEEAAGVGLEIDTTIAALLATKARVVAQVGRVPA